MIARSHRIVSRFIDGQSGDLHDTRRIRLGHDPWLRALATADDDADRTARFMDQDGDVDGMAARVVELTGTAGDIVITHPSKFHHAAFNAGHYTWLFARTVDLPHRPPSHRLTLVRSSPRTTSPI